MAPKSARAARISAKHSGAQQQPVGKAARANKSAKQVETDGTALHKSTPIVNPKMELTPTVLGSGTPPGQDTCPPLPSLPQRPHKSAQGMGLRQQAQGADHAIWKSLQLTSCSPGDGPIAGFPNPGNTCWLAATLQSLYHTSGGAKFSQARVCACQEETCPSCQLATSYGCAHVRAREPDLSHGKPLIEQLGLAWGEQIDGHDLWTALANYWVNHRTGCSKVDGDVFAKLLQVGEGLYIRKKPQCECYMETYNAWPQEQTTSIACAIQGSCQNTTVQELLTQRSRIEYIEATAADICMICDTPFQITHTRHLMNVASCGTIFVSMARGAKDKDKNRRRVEVSQMFGVVRATC